MNDDPIEPAPPMTSTERPSIRLRSSTAFAARSAAKRLAARRVIRRAMKSSRSKVSAAATRSCPGGLHGIHDHADHLIHLLVGEPVVERQGDLVLVQPERAGVVGHAGSPRSRNRVSIGIGM